MIKKSYMFKGREKELLLFFPYLLTIYLPAKRKICFILWLSKIIHCDTQVTLFSFRGKFKLHNNTYKSLI